MDIMESIEKTSFAVNGNRSQEDRSQGMNKFFEVCANIILYFYNSLEHNTHIKNLIRALPETVTRCIL